MSFPVFHGLCDAPEFSYRRLDEFFSKKVSEISQKFANKGWAEIVWIVNQISETLGREILGDFKFCFGWENKEIFDSSKISSIECEAGLRKPGKDYFSSKFKVQDDCPLSRLHTQVGPKRTVQRFVHDKGRSRSGPSGYRVR